ncbi:hypothetical protein BJF83_17675 [Nocardiopsis sp. CNR-923]|nr:hypothetical protein BJF83_17675 [Nocardiopsis sp. CNR-923]
MTIPASTSADRATVSASVRRRKPVEVSREARRPISETRPTAVWKRWAASGSATPRVTDVMLAVFAMPVTSVPAARRTLLDS